MPRWVTTGMVLAVVEGASAPTTSSAIPTCTTVSVVMLPGYQCTLGGLVFDSWGYDVATLASPTASFSGPTGYDVVFAWTGNKVTVAFRPIGASLLSAAAQGDPNGNSSSAHVMPAFTYFVTVDPALPYASLLGASAQFGAAVGTAGGTAGHYSATFNTLYAGTINDPFLYGWSQGTLQVVSYSGVPSATSYGYSRCGSPVSNNPLSTGNILCSPLAVGNRARLITGNAVNAYVFANDPTGHASVSIAAGWSNSFTTNISASTVPEPGTVVLLATGLAAMGVGRRISRRWRRSGSRQGKGV